MLDTNTISHLIKAHPAVARRVTATPMTSLCMSAITRESCWSVAARGFFPWRVIAARTVP
jgi:predicted nucleic acid-binding protein